MGQVLVTDSLVGDTDTGYAYYGIWGGQVYVEDGAPYEYPSSAQLIIVQMHVALYNAAGTLTGPGADKTIEVTLYNEGSATPFDLSFTGDESDKTMRSMETVSVQDRLYIRVRRRDDGIVTYPKITIWTDVVTDNESIACGYGNLMGYHRTEYFGYIDEFVVAHSATISDLVVRLLVAPGSGDSVTYTLEKNGVATDLAVTISSTEREGIDSVDTVAVVAGDRLEVLRTTSGSPEALAYGGVCVKVTGLVDDEYLMGGSIYYMHSGGAVQNQYASIIGSDVSNTSADALATAMNEVTLTHIRVHLTAAPGEGKSITVTLTKIPAIGGEEDTELLTIADANTTGNTDLDVIFAKGERAYLKFTHSGAISGDNIFIAWGFTAEVSPTASTVTTDKVVSATAYGNITAIGDGSNCSVRGFCYKEATSGDPNVFDDSYEVDGDLDTDGEFATGEYTVALPLVAGKLYRVRAFAINDSQLAYGTTKAAYFEYPSDSVARVSSIRRIYRPGLMRMEIGVGELGFDVEVSEAAIKRVSDEVTEPEIPDEEAEALQEQIKEILMKSTRRERDIARARQQASMQEQADRPSVFPELPTIPELLRKPTPMNVLAALSPVAFGRTVYEAGKSLISTLFKGLFG